MPEICFFLCVRLLHSIKYLVSAISITLYIYICICMYVCMYVYIIRVDLIDVLTQILGE